MAAVLTIIFIGIFMVIAVVAVMSSLRALNVSGSFKGMFNFRNNLLGFDNGVIDIDGNKVQLYYHAGSKNNPSRLQLSFSGDFFAHALLRRESGVDRFGKEIGLNQEAQLYDQTFDNSVYVECEDQDFVRQCLRSADVREGVRRSLGDFATLQVDGNKCLLVQSPCPNVSAYTPDKLKEAARVLVSFACAIPKPQPGQATATPLTDHVRASSGFLSGFGVIMIIVGVGLMIWGFAAYQPLDPGKIFLLAVKLAAPLFLIFMFYVHSQVKGLSNALALLAGAFFSFLIGVPLLLWGGLMVVNGSQDVSTPKPHATSVISKHTTRSKNSTSYHITAYPWEGNPSAYSYTVPSYEYSRINVGDPCVVTTREGLFKFTWVAAKHCGR